MNFLHQLCLHYKTCMCRKKCSHSTQVAEWHVFRSEVQPMVVFKAQKNYECIWCAHVRILLYSLLMYVINIFRTSCVIMIFHSVFLWWQVRLLGALIWNTLHISHGVCGPYSFVVTIYFALIFVLGCVCSFVHIDGVRCDGMWCDYTTCTRILQRHTCWKLETKHFITITKIISWYLISLVIIWNNKIK